MRPAELAQVLDRLAREDPDADAVVVADGPRLSRAALEARAARVAWFLGTRGVDAGTRVAVAMTNRAELVETLYAAWKRDAAIVPVDLAGGIDTTHATIDGSDAKVVVCDDERAETVAAAVRRISKRWRPHVLVAGEAYEREIAAAPPAVEALDDASQAFGLRDAPAMPRRILPAVPVVSDVGFRVAVDALGAGGTLVVVPGRRIPPIRFWEVAAAERAEVLVIAGDRFAVPLMAALASHGAALDLDALSAITSPGAPIGAEARAAIERRLPHVHVHAPMPGVAEPSARDLRRVQTVELALGRYRSVGDRAVVALTESGTVKVVAVVEVAVRHYLDEAELVAWSRSRLRGEDMPDAFVVVDRLPRTTDGALDAEAVERLARARLSAG